MIMIIGDLPVMIIYLFRTGQHKTVQYFGKDAEPWHLQSLLQDHGMVVYGQVQIPVAVLVSDFFPTIHILIQDGTLH